MPYTINNYDGTPLTTINDGQIDSTTSLELPGPNYVGYGKFLNENLVFLLESFAGNIAPSGTNLQGQLWFNKSNQTLNVFTNQGYTPVSGIIVSNSQPLTANPGNTWFSTVTNQYSLFDGTTWNLIGPTYTKSQGVSGAISVTLNDADTTGVTHNIIQIQFGPFILATLSSDASFRPSPSISGFTRINPGITLNSTITSPTFNSNVVGTLTGNVIGSLTGAQVSATTLLGTLIGSVTGPVTGNITSTSSVATNFSSANILVSGGNANGLTTLQATTAQATNLSSGNILVSGGNANGLTTLQATTAQATNFSSANILVLSGNVTGLTTLQATTAQATNFSSANILVSGGNASGLTTLQATTAQATNFSSANAVIVNAGFTTAQATNLSSGNILVSGGNVNGLTTLQATTAQATNLSSGNILVTSGNVNGLTTLGVACTQSTNFSSANILVSGGNVNGLTTLGVTTAQATNLSSGNILVTGGKAIGLLSLSATTAQVTNLSTSNILVLSGNVNGLTTLQATTAQATNFSSANIAVSNASFTTATATNFSCGNITGSFNGTVSALASAPTLPYSSSNTAVATTAFVQSVIPQGVILMWAGSVANIPVGWHLCDGTNSTPDLRGQFIIGAGGTYPPNQTAGNVSVTLATGNLPSHIHSLSGVTATGTTGLAGGHTHTATSTVADSGHTHSTSESAHNHSITDSGHRHNIGIQGGNGSVNAANDLVGDPGQRQGATRTTETATTGITLGAATTGLTLNVATTGLSVATGLSTASDHSHSINASLSGNTIATGSGTPFSILPPYYALCYIQKMF